MSYQSIQKFEERTIRAGKRRKSLSLLLKKTAALCIVGETGTVRACKRVHFNLFGCENMTIKEVWLSVLDKKG